MKKLLFFLFLCVIILIPLFSEIEEYPLETNNGMITLFIPDNFDELRDAYIEMSRLYIDERNDLEDLMLKVENYLPTVIKLTDNTNELTTQLTTYVATTQDLIDLIDRIQQAKNIQHYISGEIGYAFSDIPQFGIGYHIEFVDKFYFGVYGEYPWAIGISMGIKIK